MRYDGPAGLVLSPDEARFVLDSLVRRSLLDGQGQSELIARIGRYLANDWESRAEDRSRAME